MFTSVPVGVLCGMWDVGVVGFSQPPKNQPFNCCELSHDLNMEKNCFKSVLMRLVVDVFKSLSTALDKY